jgi:glycerol-1-phosphate dehydrogenase [NAD(P)+]
LELLINEALAPAGECACGRNHAVPIRIVRLDDVGGTQVVAAIRRLTGLERDGGNIMIVADSKTYAVHAARIAHELARTLMKPFTLVFSAGAEGSENRTADLVVSRPEDSAPLAPDDQAIQRVVAAADPDCELVLVSVGSGTLTDICKAAATLRGVRCIVCPTAASMNGYTSTIAALKREGLKVTESVNGVDAVIVDMDIIVGSPPAMTAAGVADLLSKFVCHADWTIAHLLDGGYHCTVPSALASRATEAVIAHLDAIEEHDRDGLTVLMQALLLSGLAMAMAGSSSPASGGEHLISHYWDMMCPHTGGRRYHGTQVGIGILISATLYERLRRIEPRTIDPRKVADRVEDWTALEHAIRDHFGHAADAVLAQARAKYLAPERAAARAAQIAQRWPEIWTAVDPILKPAAQVREWLHRCNAPMTVAQLGVTRTHAVDAVRWARHLRNRFTVFDLAAQIGVWGAQHQAEALDASGVLG